MLSQQCDLIEQLDATNQINLMHAQIRKTIRAHKGNATTTCLEDKDGNIIMDQDKIELAGLNISASCIRMIVEDNYHTISLIQLVFRLLRKKFNMH